MLVITIPSAEWFDEERNMFIRSKERTLHLVHSLVSVSKWEATWHKPFLSKDRKTLAESIDYVRCMTLTQNVDPKVYKLLTNENMTQINDYIASPMSATKIPQFHKSKGPNREVVTSELIYYWMIALGIPFECQKWHLNRLLNLIEICNIKNQPKKKMSKREIMSRNRSLNAERKKALNTKG